MLGYPGLENVAVVACSWRQVALTARGLPKGTSQGHSPVRFQTWCRTVLVLEHDYRLQGSTTQELMKSKYGMPDMSGMRGVTGKSGTRGVLGTHRRQPKLGPSPSSTSETHRGSTTLSRSSRASPHSPDQGVDGVDEYARYAVHANYARCARCARFVNVGWVQTRGHCPTPPVRTNRCTGLLPMQGLPGM